MIKNIIFDFGGVILPIDTSKTAQEFEKLGLSNFEALYSLKKQEQFFDDFEKGKISAQNFRNEIRKQYSRPLSDEEIDFAWNALLGELNPERFSFLTELKDRYKIFLLSNTNTIHHAAFTRALNHTFGKGNFEGLFEKTYYSFHTKFRKPEKQIYELVIKENFLRPAECVFIDDNLANAKAAQDAGMNAIHHESSMEIEKDLMAMLSAF
jgi:putative hydrolase of the HAD superfamily